jgi:hypothetical protein
MSYDISFSNKKVFEFYQQHKSLDIESINVLFVNILEMLYEDINPALSSTLASNLLENIRTLQQQMNTMNDTITKSQSDLSTIFAMKFIEFKKEYIEDLKMILTNTTSEKIAPVIKQYNESLLDKTQLLIKELVPKNNEQLSTLSGHISREIETAMKELQHSLNTDTTKLLQQSVNKDSLSKFVSTLDEKFNSTLVNSQTIMNNLIAASEQRLDSRITDIRNLTTQNFADIREISTTNNGSQTNLQTTITELLRKMENSSSKGKISENILYNIITPLYPTAEILSVGSTKETGDIMIHRKDKPTILLENKNYDRNVTTDEVKKFLRDIDTQNCCGIMLAQHSGIANKDNYQIDYINGNIVMFIHNVEYQPERIKIAIDIIDSLKIQMSELQYDSGDTTVDKSVLEAINLEYQNFITQKMSHIKTIKDFNQRLISQIEEFNIPSLEHLLNKMFTPLSTSVQETCEYCKKIFKNQRALSTHYRGCEEKKNFKPSAPINIVITKK